MHQSRWLTVWYEGSPRVGNVQFCKLLEQNVPDIWRVVVRGDPVRWQPAGRASLKWVAGDSGAFQNGMG